MIWFEDFLVCPKGWDAAKDRDLVETHIKSPTLEDAMKLYKEKMKLREDALSKFDMFKTFINDSTLNYEQLEYLLYKLKNETFMDC
jgi:hypothetical protein